MSSKPPKSRVTRTIEFDQDVLWQRFWWGIGVGALITAPTVCWLVGVLRDVGTALAGIGH